MRGAPARASGRDGNESNRHPVRPGRVQERSVPIPLRQADFRSEMLGCSQRFEREHVQASPRSEQLRHRPSEVPHRQHSDVRRKVDDRRSTTRPNVGIERLELARHDAPERVRHQRATQSVVPSSGCPYRTTSERELRWLPMKERSQQEQIVEDRGLQGIAQRRSGSSAITASTSAS